MSGQADECGLLLLARQRDYVRCGGSTVGVPFNLQHAAARYLQGLPTA